MSKMYKRAIYRIWRIWHGKLECCKRDGWKRSLCIWLDDECNRLRAWEA